MSLDSEKIVPGSPAQWMIHAKSDLGLARLGAADPSILHEQVGFHAQQAALKKLVANRRALVAQRVAMDEGISFD